MRFALASILLSLALGTSAHPGEEHHHDDHAALAKRTFLEHSGRSYSTCSNSARKRDLSAQIATRRAREIDDLRSALKAKKSALFKSQSHSKRQSSCRRQTDSGSAGGGGGSSSLTDYGEALVNTSHASNLTTITANITSAELFNSTDGETSACLLQPEVTIGPYWVSGEYVRSNVTEDQQGVPLYLSTQVIDVATCEPVPELYWEIWHCNATGVYSGVVSSGNGDSSDESNLNNTFLRGLVETDDLGVATFETIFPGHYTGRATHIHVVGHANATLYSNGTIGTGASGSGNSSAIHIGQLFFDQDLITEVEATSPYSTNTQDITENASDSIFAEEAIEGASDPLVEYVLLGDSIEDGVYAWVTVGVTTNETMTTSAAAYLTPDGGVENTESSLGGGGGMGGNSTSGGDGSAPSGSPPS
ncbi:hypothetical protein I302_101325 [Kwoniella bestiolae CBS 10118]|uniref:Intradiol ring-cleavage dioxygenases domain-containing protein n=1 Tax=Kwoniella bestiolae CBS 10118 TaxID=1296100 RepID=A0A1B9GBX8_9TREE|nr:hypothetical protein I302_00008 [Kwoniella bestiolae CBS 10118]OCF28521.1 hypothetical protein I302_00008 [Kwoniella bestiolae CBS 10118]